MMRQSRDAIKELRNVIGSYPPQQRYAFEPTARFAGNNVHLLESSVDELLLAIVRSLYRSRDHEMATANSMD